jgi:acyl-CoA thioesterase-2
VQVTSHPPEDTTFVDLLELEPIDRDIFRGMTHAGAPMRTFGGQVAAQALVAAGRTAGDRHVHSLHSYFLRPGNPEQPIIYLVDRLRDGGSFTTRRVAAVQSGEAIFSLSASFKDPEESGAHQRNMPSVRPPQESLDLYKAAEEAGETEDRAAAVAKLVIELRGPDPTSRFAGSQVPADANGEGEAIGLLDDEIPRRRFWMRAFDRLPDDPLMHVCALAYMSDLTLAGTATLHQDIPPPELMLASLDHAMWFHRPFRADEWLLFSIESPTSADGRGIALGEYWSEDGRLVASVVQEALIRRRR